MGAQDDAEHLRPADAAQWRAWLAEHHASAPGVWVATTHDGEGGVGYEDAVLEALCDGWIDGLTRSCDGRREIWFSPRRSRSGWARTNKVRIERLEAEGRMRPAGRRVVEAARENGTWTLLDDAEALVMPDDLADALAAADGARAFFDAMPPSARKVALTQLALARRPQTRAARVASVAEACAEGRRPGA